MAKPRKPWSQLTPAVKARKRRAGITPQQYNAGKVPTALNRAARGHAATPERPSQAFRDSDVYAKYLERRHDRGQPLPEGLAEEIQSRREREAILERRRIGNLGPGYVGPQPDQERWGYPPGFMVIYPPRRGGKNGPDLRTRVHIHHNDGRDNPDEWHTIDPDQTTDAILAARAAGYAADYYSPSGMAAA